MCSSDLPKALAANFGSASIGIGFTSRLNMIYSDDYKVPNLFGTQDVPDMETFKQDLVQMASLNGRFKFSAETRKEFQAWVSSGMEPAPTDAKLQEYLPRRWLHLAKLCMIYSAAEGNDLVINLKHYNAAKDTLLEAESVLHNALEFMGNSTVMEAIRNVHSWMTAEFTKTKTGISEIELKKKLLADVPPQSLNSTIVELVMSGYIKQMGAGADRRYLPLPKTS